MDVNLTNLSVAGFETEFTAALSVLKEQSQKKGRMKRSNCPDGTGNYGFNTYNLMTSALLGFNAVANLMANVNNNDQENSISIVVGNNKAMVITIVPPIGPPIPVVVGRALQNGTMLLDERFKKKGIYFEDGNKKDFFKKEWTKGQYRTETFIDMNRNPRELIPISNMTRTDDPSEEWFNFFSA